MTSTLTPKVKLWINKYYLCCVAPEANYLSIY